MFWIPALQSMDLMILLFSRNFWKTIDRIDREKGSEKFLIEKFSIHLVVLDILTIETTYHVTSFILGANLHITNMLGKYVI